MNGCNYGHQAYGTYTHSLVVGNRMFIGLILDRSRHSDHGDDASGPVDRCCPSIIPRHQGRALFNHRRAQRNSVARIASPPGTTRKAGPGNTSMAMPTGTTLPPNTDNR